MKLFSLLLFTFFISSCDVVSSSYATYQDAKNDQLFERGWLPEILPHSTTNIKISNNLDLNTSTGDFQLPKKDLPLFKSKLIQQSENQYIYTESRGTDKWLFTIKENGYVQYTLE